MTKTEYWVIDDWYDQKIKIIKNTNATSSQEVLFWEQKKNVKNI
jgi:hypothetical protein